MGNSSYVTDFIAYISHGAPAIRLGEGLLATTCFLHLQVTVWRTNQPDLDSSIYFGR